MWVTNDLSLPVPLMWVMRVSIRNRVRVGIRVRMEIRVRVGDRVRVGIVVRVKFNLCFCCERWDLCVCVCVRVCVCCLGGKFHPVLCVCAWVSK